jgi:hypothetical protein
MLHHYVRAPTNVVMIGRLVNALIAHSKHYDMLMFPEERHQPRGFLTQPQYHT